MCNENARSSLIRYDYHSLAHNNADADADALTRISSERQIPTPIPVPANDTETRGIYLRDAKDGNGKEDKAKTDRQTDR